MEEIRDIVGLQPITWWPLAWGWWLIITCVFILFVVTAALVYQRILYNKSWRGQANRRLNNLAGNLDRRSLKGSLNLLSTEIRNIAMHSSSRQDCAGLTSFRWLQWLEEHDPQGYAWTAQAAILVDGPYAPPAEYSVEKIKGMIDAIRKWVKR